MSRAVVAGAGYGGLTAALTLRRQGWDVTVFERAPNVRSEGYSIAFHENGLRTLEALGLVDRALEQSIRLPGRQTRDGKGRVTARFDADYRVYRISRPHLVGVLAEAAAAEGVDLRFGSEVAGADPEGALILKDGTREAADLVVVADGVNSTIPEALGLLKSRKKSDEGAIRVIMPRIVGEIGAGDDGLTGFEFWSARRRFMYRAASEDTAYCTFCCPSADARGRQTPIDPTLWGDAFPAIRGVIERVAAEGDWSTPRWVQFQTITLHRWYSGRVAVVGDAAHAMHPNLGQGGNCAIMNAHAMARHIGQGSDVPAALARWEAAERPVIDHAQTWSMRFTAPLAWPEWLRALALPTLGRSGWLRAQMTRPARHVPKTS